MILRSLESVKNTESKSDPKVKTLTSPQESLLDLSLKQLGYRTIKVWNEMFQEIIELNTQDQYRPIRKSYNRY